MSSFMRDLVLWSETISALSYQATPDRPTYCINAATLGDDFRIQLLPFLAYQLLSYLQTDTPTKWTLQPSS